MQRLVHQSASCKKYGMCCLATWWTYPGLIPTCVCLEPWYADPAVLALSACSHCPSLVYLLMSCLMPYITHRVFNSLAQERCRSDIQWRISRTSVEEYPAVESEVKHQLDHHEAAAFSALPVTTWSPQSGLSHSDTGKLYRQVLEDFKSTWNDMMTGICWGNYYSFPLWLTFRNNYWQENWRLWKVGYSLIPEKLN